MTGGMSTQMKRDANVPRRVPSFIVATGQRSRVVVAVAMLAILVVAMGLQTRVGPPIDGLWVLLFDFAGIGMLGWAVASIRCPGCGCRVVWHAMATESFRSWGDVFEWVACPECGLCPGGDAPAAAAPIAAALEAVAAGEMSALTAMSHWPAIRDRLFDEAWHALSHFENDVDIRRRDEAYDHYQRDCLRALASRVRDRFGVD
jgi:hypothetical protein